MNNQVVISTPPHVKSPRTTKGIMLDVIIALIPASVMGIVYVHLDAFIVILTSILGCVATEFVYYFIANKGFGNKCKNAGAVCKKWWKQFDLTSIVTGLILALILPPATKWYEVLLGAIFSIAVVKMLFGGTGKNLVNPAATGRIFMFMSFTITVYSACKLPPSVLTVNCLRVQPTFRAICSAERLPQRSAGLTFSSERVLQVALAKPASLR